MNVCKACALTLSAGPWRVGTAPALMDLDAQLFHDAVAGGSDGGASPLESKEKPPPGPDPPRALSEIEEGSFDVHSEGRDEVFVVLGPLADPELDRVKTRRSGSVEGHPLHHLLMLSGAKNIASHLIDTGPDDAGFRAQKGEATAIPVSWAAAFEPERLARGPAFPVAEQRCLAEIALPGLSPRSDAASLAEGPVFFTSVRVDSAPQLWGATPTLVRVERLSAELQAVVLASQQTAGLRVIQIRLDPVELGRVRIMLQMTDAGLHVQFMVERPETLELMRRFATDFLQDLAGLGFPDLMMSLSDHSDGAENTEKRGKGAVDTSDVMQVVGAEQIGGAGEVGGMDLRV